LPILGTTSSSTQKNIYANVGWWDLNTWTSGTLTDLSGNGYHGTYNASAGTLTSQTFRSRVGRGLSGVANTPCFTIAKAYDLTEATIMFIGTKSGANNGKYAIQLLDSPVTDNITGTMEGAFGYANKPLGYGNGGFFPSTTSTTEISLYTFVIPSSTSFVSQPDIKLNGTSVIDVPGITYPTTTKTHVNGKLMIIDDYGGTGSATWWEIKVFNKALTPSQVTTEEAYFKTKWSL
jgi:hypothetical protein